MDHYRSIDQRSNERSPSANYSPSNIQCLIRDSAAFQEISNWLLSNRKPKYIVRQRFWYVRTPTRCFHRSWPFKWVLIPCSSRRRTHASMWLPGFLEGLKNQICCFQVLKLLQNKLFRPISGLSLCLKMLSSHTRKRERGGIRPQETKKAIEREKKNNRKSQKSSVWHWTKNKSWPQWEEK